MEQGQAGGHAACTIEAPSPAWFYFGASTFHVTAVQGRIRTRAMPEPVIVADSEIMRGTPCFRGTRVPFRNLIDYLEGGHSLGEFLRQFPSVTREMAVQALEEAKDSLLARIG